MTNPGSRMARETVRGRPPLRFGAGLPRRLAGGVAAGAAALVLALATGVPLRSAQMLLPDPNERATPYLGI